MSMQVCTQAGIQAAQLAHSIDEMLSLWPPRAKVAAGAAPQRVYDRED